jgi:phage terminase large subunit GpA-like protein
MVGANSPTNLAMRPIRIVLSDEVDKFPVSAGVEGDPIDLAEERQAEFSSNRLSVRACSPTIEGRSRIDNSYKESDQRKAFVACPHCAGEQELVWGQVRWVKDPRGRIDLNSAQYYCSQCDKPWTEAERLRALQAVTWRQTREFDCCGKHQKPEQWKMVQGVGRALCSECGRLAVPNDHAGFHASKLYAPKQSIKDLVRKFRRAHETGPEALKTFYNTQLARTWKESGEAPAWETVYNRKDDYLLGTVPGGGLVLFAGVDVQKDRLEVRIWAFGRSRQRWLVDIRVLPGSPILPAVWKELETLFGETWTHEGGAELGVRDWGIDSGSYSSEVAAFVRSQQGRANVHAVRGYDDSTQAFVGVGKMDITAGGKKISRGLRTLKIGVSFCKHELMGQLALDRPVGDAEYAPGFVHLPQDVTDDEVKQLTSEELVTVSNRGKRKREWKLSDGRRNEGLDCANYARGLAAMRGWDRWKEASFKELEQQLYQKTEDGLPVAVPGPPRPRGRRVRSAGI